MIICFTALYLLPESKNNLTVETVEEKSVISSINKDILNNKKDRETVNENSNVLEEPGNEISMNNDNLNQIGIPPNFEKRDNGR